MDEIRQWFVEHAMGPMFQLGELARETGVAFTLSQVDKTVTFDGSKSTHYLGKLLDGKTLKYGTWEPVEKKVVQVEPVPVKQETKQIKDTDLFPSIGISG